MKNAILFLFIILVVACSSPEVYHHIMSKAYVDILILKEKFPQGSDSLKAATNRTFEKYKIKSEDYYSTLKSYETNQEKWDEFFKGSREYLDSLKAENKSN